MRSIIFCALPVAVSQSRKLLVIADPTTSDAGGAGIGSISSSPVAIVADDKDDEDDRFSVISCLS